MEWNVKALRMTGLVLALGGHAIAGKVYLNQLGFPVDATKQAVYVQGTGSATLTVCAPGNPGTAVQAVTSGTPSTWEPSGEMATRIDFTALTTPGTYAICEDGVVASASFKVGNDVYRDVLKGTLKWFYYQRASTELLTEHAGDWARKAGHPDTVVYEHSSVGTRVFSAPKGWYDAGDYGKYIVNSGITTYTLQSLYDHYPALFDTLTWNIPESGNGFPDLLDEIQWNLEWMLAMQDPSDGGVYHKLTTLNFSGDVMPVKDVAKRYVVMKTTAASYDFAAVMAMAARQYSLKGQHDMAGRCYDAARAAFAWAENNSDVPYVQPSGIGTGTYNDYALADERTWAVIMLARVGADPSYAKLLGTPMEFDTSIPWWGGVSTLGTYEVMRHPDIFGTALSDIARANVATAAAAMLQKTQSASYGIATENFGWGSNSQVANEAVLLLQGYYITNDKQYLDAAQAHFDYLLGRNPLDISYVTGFGARSPLKPHHRPSQADGIVAPVPGMLVGGPHNGGNDVAACKMDYRVDGKPALSYYDNNCSYATNEVAINWNAPMAYLAGALYALHNGVANPTALQPVQKSQLDKSSPFRMVFDGSAVRLRHTQRDGSRVEYGVKGTRLR